MSQTSDPSVLIAQIKDKLGIGEDKVYAVMGEFAEPDELVEAGRRIRGMGYIKIDALTPFPVHGIDEAIGVPYLTLPTRFPRPSNWRSCSPRSSPFYAPGD